MKRILFLLFLMVLGTSVFAQKRYVNVCANEVSDEYATSIYLSGAIPSDMENYYKNKIGNVLNMLAERGYVLEQMSSSDYQGYTKEIVIMSTSSTTPSNAIKHIYEDDEVEATEVARYNLQGIPISENEKGIQIVVYSDYTTKTIIVE